MILGIILAVLLLFEFLLSSTKKGPKVHCCLGRALLSLGTLHALLTVNLFLQRPLTMYITGILLLCLLLAALTSQKRKNLLNSTTLHKWMMRALIPILLIHCYSGFSSLSSYQSSITQLSIPSIDFTKIPNGIYEGQYDVGYIYAKVKVSVTNGVITDIQLIEHRNERGTPAEAILSSIQSEQRIDVDAISGATNSSKVLQAAIINALEKGGE